MENFDLLKKIINKVGIKFISKKLGVNVGTIKRWIELKNVPNYYKIDLMELNDITIDYSVLNAKEKDQFFTCNETAKKCFSIFLEKMNELNIDISEYTFVEPSVGSGSFYSLFPKDNRIGIDIESSINEVIISDYLKWSPDESKKYIVLGNPPFGLRGNMALRFLNHSNYADFVAFILPQIFESDGKGSCKKRVKGFDDISVLY